MVGCGFGWVKRPGGLRASTWNRGNPVDFSIRSITSGQPVVYSIEKLKGRERVGDAV